MIMVHKIFMEMIEYGNHSYMPPFMIFTIHIRIYSHHEVQDFFHGTVQWGLETNSWCAFLCALIWVAKQMITDDEYYCD